MPSKTSKSSFTADKIDITAIIFLLINLLIALTSDQETKKMLEQTIKSVLKLLFLSMTPKSLRIIHWNVNGIQNKINEFNTLLITEKIDIALVGETRTKPINAFKIPNYYTYHANFEINHFHSPPHRLPPSYSKHQTQLNNN